MKMNLLAAGAMLLAVCSCNAKNEVKITYEEGLQHPDTIFVEHNLLADQLKATTPEELNLKYDTVVWKNGAFTFNIDEAGPAEYSFRISDDPTPDSLFEMMFAEPGQNISIHITSLSPVTFTAKGSPLMEGIAKLQDETAPVMREYKELMKTDAPGIEAIQAVTKKYVDVNTKFIKENPNSPAAVYAAIMLADDDSYGDLFANLTPEAKKSILYPFAEKYFEKFQAQLEVQKKVDALASGTVKAFDFSLPGLNGKNISLSEFKGKWVILDFWGSWCRWCIKGIPELKEAYAKYKAKGLEVIGVDCGDTDADWRAAVKQYELPWVQVFNGDDKTLIEKYGVQGYPTKVIINPEGYIVNVTTGEDPNFYNILADFLK